MMLMKDNKLKIIVVVGFVLIILLGIILFLFFNKDDKNDDTENNTENINMNSPYRITGNDLEDFDLYFLQLENEETNKVYSPLSIKYALEMLAEGANNNTKSQIMNILGTYKAKKYTNNSNVSFANGIFINTAYQNMVKSSFISNLKNKFNADVMYDTFTDASAINSWISNKTLNLINNVYDDVSDLDYILLNALAIDMEWNNVLQSVNDTYQVQYINEKAGIYVDPLNESDYYELEFTNVDYDVKASTIGGIVNKYDIVEELGEENIRSVVTEAYNQWLKNAEEEYIIDNFDAYLDQYINDIDSNYKDISSSTDFKFYVDNDIKIFSKDLKPTNEVTLEYIGIMPTKEKLSEFIKDINAKKINKLISQLKDFDYKNFEDGFITKVYGHIPLFNFEYELNMLSDLKKLGITDLFDSKKVDLSNLTDGESKIIELKHKTNIEFSNEGIKAAAMTMAGGAGDAPDGSFSYEFEVPIKEIDITFDQPYMFLIRDKNSQEVWFVGTVYEPMEYISMDLLLYPELFQ